MLARISCPACHNQSSIPEGDMGTRQVCAKCHSPFIAGKALTEPQGAGNPTSGAAAAYNKTMLGDTASAIKYNCPRCQAPLEALSIEAGTKKSCPACSQRIQVPAAPPPPAPAPQPSLLNRTMLTAEDRWPAAPPIKYNCPACRKPLEAPASEAGVKKPCPACGQRHQVPAAAAPAARQPNLNKTMLAADPNSPQPIGGQPGYSTLTAPGAAPGAPAPAPAPAGLITIGSYTISKRTLAIGAVVAVLLLIFVVPAVIRGGKTEDLVAAAAQKQELERATAEVQRRQAELESLNKFENEQRDKIKSMEDKQSADEQRRRDDFHEAVRSITDQKLRADMEDKYKEQDRKAEQEKREREKEQQKILADAKAAADASKAALDAAKQQQQTIIQQPPPVYYAPPYSWRYYYPW
jgi:DNA-directed RNA polymerase subunit RPC12/RpoP